MSRDLRRKRRVVTVRVTQTAGAAREAIKAVAPLEGENKQKAVEEEEVEGGCERWIKRLW